MNWWVWPLMAWLPLSAFLAGTWHWVILTVADDGDSRQPDSEGAAAVEPDRRSRSWG